MFSLFCYSYIQEKIEEHKKNINNYKKIEIKEYDISLYNLNKNIIYKEETIHKNNEIEI